MTDKQREMIEQAQKFLKREYAETYGGTWKSQEGMAEKYYTELGLLVNFITDLGDK